jgi:hypothetical protein
MPVLDTTTAAAEALRIDEYVSLVRRARPYVGWGAIFVALGILAALHVARPAWVPTDANVSFEPYSYYGGHGVAYEAAAAQNQARAQHQQDQRQNTWDLAIPGL